MLPMDTLTHGKRCSLPTAQGTNHELLRSETIPTPTTTTTTAAAAAAAAASALTLADEVAEAVAGDGPRMSQAAFNKLLVHIYGEEALEQINPPEKSSPLPSKRKKALHQQQTKGQQESSPSHSPSVSLRLSLSRPQQEQERLQRKQTLGKDQRKESKESKKEQKKRKPTAAGQRTTKVKKNATNYAPYISDYLKKALFEMHARGETELTRTQRLETADYTGLDSRQITYWFATNKRRFAEELKEFKQLMEDPTKSIQSFEDFVQLYPNKMKLRMTGRPPPLTPYGPNDIHRTRLSHS
ncbi:hypothetical protein BCR43DRAFT_490327 [Syncephalastrum racemosum]|uniref:Homeobox domain-containing protein n=1 Tax=Syncephalastrum racemosum TaxID=13706 RepID=A0A1X2HFR2_SYNRA|nr:hypothetical protein BCR43DRAFT_490327 [Syncephalastrum racemosum]